jgi:o-succinylbenzoate synthase
VVTIRHVELVPFAIPLRTPLATAYGPVTSRRGVVVILTDDEGREGIGEATPHPAAPPAAQARAHAELAQAAGWLAGAELSRLDELLRRTQQLSRPAAMGLDMALHDLAARATGRSVAALLGGRLRSVVPVSALLDDADAGVAARDAVARGFTTAKLKVGPDADAAVARAAAVRAAAPALALRCDANGAWDVATAISVARRLARLGIAWLEQPVTAADVAGLSRVRAAGGVTVAADEAVTGAAAIPALARAADAVVLKLVQVGGLAAARDAATAARRHGLRVTVTTGLETSLATVAALHLAAALPDPLEPCGLATASLLAGDLVAAPPPCGPTMRLPDGPGLGIRLDRAALEQWRDRSRVL